MSQQKTSKGIRIAEIVLGAIAIGLAIFVISNPDTTTVVLMLYLGISLVLIGAGRIIAGAMYSAQTKSFRAISVGTGVLSIIGGIFAMANPVAAVATLIMIVSIFILIHGLGLIGSGIISGQSRGTRISSIILGGIAVAFAIILLAYPGLALVMMIIFMSMGLFFNGLGSILSGITGIKK